VKIDGNIIIILFKLFLPFSAMLVHIVLKEKKAPALSCAAASIV